MPLPEKIKLGGQEYVLKDNPELLNLVQEARKEEKDKLHGEIKLLKGKISKGGVDAEQMETLKTQLAEAEEAKKVANEELVGLKAVQKKLEEEKNKGGDAGGDGGDDPDKGKKKTMTSHDFELKLSEFGKSMTDQFGKVLEDRFKKYDESIGNLTKQNSQMTVEAHKQKLLADNEGLIIPDLLTGGTIDELNTSLVKALETSKKYITAQDNEGNRKTLAEIEKAKIEAEKKAGDGTQTQQVSVVDLLSITDENGEKKFSVAQPPKGGATDGDLVKDLDEMSPEEFEKNRDAIKKQLMAEQKGE